MAAINQLLASLAAKPLVPSDQYDGVEYRWKFLTFRPAEFKIDVILLGVAVAYVLAYIFGKSANSKRAHAWYDAHKSLLSSQFSKPTKDGLLVDGSSDFVNFSTGRRSVRALHSVFRLLPRHDLVQLVWQFVWTNVDLKYRPEDVVTLDFELDEKASAAVPDCVWAVVTKDELSTIKDGRWDLTFTKTTENSAVSPTLSVMSELADVTDNILKPFGNTSIPKLLSDPGNLKYFRSLSITDQPDLRPTGPVKPEEHKKLVILSLACPPPSEASATVPLVSGVLQLIDALAGHGGKPLLALRPESRTKLKRRRDELVAELKAESEKETKEAEKEAKEAKEAAKRKAEQERIASLPAAEQAKILERERKRSMRKSQQGRMVRK